MIQIKFKMKASAILNISLKSAIKLFLNLEFT